MNTISRKDFSSISTPFYYYDMELLEKTLMSVNKLKEKYNYHIHYALKANSNPEILKLIQSYGLGADCVSGNEILRAVESGFENNKIVFAGVGKSDAEINIALDNNIFCFNCESIPEIEVINKLAGIKNKVASISLRLNPDVDAKTHKYITTGLDENKFGINLKEIDEVLDVIAGLDNIKLTGLHFHIGSQITDLSVYKGLCIRINEVQQKFLARQIAVNHINVGGGLGIDYNTSRRDEVADFESYFQIFNDFLELIPGQELHFEPGRSIVGHCGSLISRVLYVKHGTNTDFAIIDAGMTELIRPALYRSVHRIENITSNSQNIKKYDVVGPICESSDSFAKAIDLPETQRGDLIEIRTTGAYGQVMSSRYNLRDLAKSYYSS